MSDACRIRFVSYWYVDDVFLRLATLHPLTIDMAAAVVAVVAVVYFSTVRRAIVCFVARRLALANALCMSDALLRDACVFVTSKFIKSPVNYSSLFNVAWKALHVCKNFDFYYCFEVK